MCGFIYNVTSFPLLEPLFDIAGYEEETIREILTKPFLRPTDTVLNLVPTRSGAQIMPATWWLATDVNGNINPKVTSFNAQSRRLSIAKIHQQKPRSIRSVVLASGFCEWQPVVLQEDLLEGAASKKGSQKRQMLIELNGSNLMIMGAVSKLRLKPDGSPQINTAVITLPPHPDFAHIHEASFPLLLRKSELADWLNPDIPLEHFSDLLATTQLRMDIDVTNVDKELNRLGESDILRSVKGGGR